MTKETQQKLITEFFAERKNTLISKGEDYAQEDDVLSNFKGSAANIGVTTEMQILSLISTKVARLGNLLKKKTAPKNESIEDSVKDLGCYTDLLYCALKEKAGNAKSEPEEELEKSDLTPTFAPPLPERYWYINEKGNVFHEQEGKFVKGLPEQHDIASKASEVPDKYPTVYHRDYEMKHNPLL